MQIGTPLNHLAPNQEVHPLAEKMEEEASLETDDQTDTDESWGEGLDEYETETNQNELPTEVELDEVQSEADISEDETDETDEPSESETEEKDIMDILFNSEEKETVQEEPVEEAPKIIKPKRETLLMKKDKEIKAIEEQFVKEYDAINNNDETQPIETESKEISNAFKIKYLRNSKDSHLIIPLDE